MAFCGNCGKELMKGAKFCFNCGKAVAANQNDAMEQRKIIYEGKIYKCPNCGEVLSAFDVMCPSCGYEIRGSKASNSVKEFAMQLANIENDKQKITLIQSYPIPNNKGDILEFMILAATCFEPGENVTGDAAKKDVSYAWYAKVEQSYQKAKILFANDVDFIKIQNVYNQTCNKFKMAASMERKKKIGQLILRTIGLWGGLIALIIAFFITSQISPILQFKYSQIRKITDNATSSFFLNFVIVPVAIFKSFRSVAGEISFSISNIQSFL